MSTSKSQTKKTASKPVEPKPKYKIGDRVFYISYHKGKPEEIFQVKITGRDRRENELVDGSGKKTAAIRYTYSWAAATISFLSVPPTLDEGSIHPSFQSAAHKFAEPFTTLLK
jgi:hypothetical protein